MRDPGKMTLYCHEREVRGIVVLLSRSVASLQKNSGFVTRSSRSLFTFFIYSRLNLTGLRKLDYMSF